MSEPRNFERSGPREWTPATIRAWCEANGKNPALFLNPAPPPNPQPGAVERMIATNERRKA